LAGEAGIVRDDLGRHEIVGLDELIAAGGPEAGDGVGGGLVGREGDDAEVAEALASDERNVVVAAMNTLGLSVDEIRKVLVEVRR
jgi:hypothetical protein